jgi:hypothetical protein
MGSKPWIPPENRKFSNPRVFARRKAQELICNKAALVGATIETSQNRFVSAYVITPFGISGLF